MQPDPAAIADLPRDFPVFPLAGALLLPHGRLPLNIFEPRYLAMTEDALAAGRHIAMIQPDAAAARGTTGPALHRTGCLGRLTSFSETEDGRYLITLGGIIRFDVAAELDMARGYRRVRGDYARYAADLADPADQSLADAAHARLVASLRGYFDRRGIDANWAALEAMPPPALVVTIAMGCPFAPIEKQALLEAPDFAQRAATLQTLLDIDSHEPAGDDTPRRPS